MAEDPDGRRFIHHTRWTSRHHHPPPDEAYRFLEKVRATYDAAPFDPDERPEWWTETKARPPRPGIPNTWSPRCKPPDHDDEDESST